MCYFFGKVLFGKVLLLLLFVLIRDLKYFSGKVLSRCMDASLPLNHMEDIHADANDPVVEEERMVEEETEGYDEAVSLTLSQEDHTSRIRDSIARCTQGAELIRLVGELPINRLASSKSVTTNRVIKKVNGESVLPLKSLKNGILQKLGLDPEDKIPSLAELDKMGKADCVLKALGETSDNVAIEVMKAAALEGFKRKVRA